MQDRLEGQATLWRGERQGLLIRQQRRRCVAGACLQRRRGEPQQDLLLSGVHPAVLRQQPPERRHAQARVDACAPASLPHSAGCESAAAQIAEMHLSDGIKPPHSCSGPADHRPSSRATLILSCGQPAPPSLARRAMSLPRPQQPARSGSGYIRRAG